MLIYIDLIQQSGVRFLWSNLIVSFAEAKKKGSGGGCILAHCMGLGKTFTTISFTLTLLSSPLITELRDPTALAERVEEERIRDEKLYNGEISALPLSLINTPVRSLIHKVLILAPVNTLKNWEDEYRNWTPVELQGHTNVKLIISVTPEAMRMKILRSWNTDGGVLIIGYEMFRRLTGNVTEATTAADDAVAAANDKSSSQTTGRTKPLTPAEKRRESQAEARR